MSKLHQCALAVARNPAVADDVVQIAFEHALKQWMSFAPQGAGSRLRWLKQIIRNTCVNLHRVQKRTHKLADAISANDVTPDVSATAPVMFARELDRLSEKQRIVLMAVDVHGMKYTTIAREFNMPLGSVSKTLFCARRALERPLAKAAADYGVAVPKRATR